MVKYINECRDMDIQVLPPDINSSQLYFTVEGDAIRFGLAAVKNVGEGAVENILEARQQVTAFSSLHQFCRTVVPGPRGALDRFQARHRDPHRRAGRRRKRARHRAGDQQFELGPGDLLSRALPHLARPAQWITRGETALKKTSSASQTIVITGPDPVIHESWVADACWIAGSCPAMTAGSAYRPVPVRAVSGTSTTGTGRVI